MICRREIEERLKAIRPRRLKDQYSGEAAVLIGLVERQGRLLLLLTRRTEDVATHKGQISFPGGMREAGDTSPVDTALRETREELGVYPGAIQVVGEFHEYLAVTDQKVRCIVGYIDPEVDYHPQLDEVAYILEVPLEFFAETQPRVDQRFRQGRVQNVYFFDFNGEDIWGLTARIIRDFVEFLKLEPKDCSLGMD